MRLSLRITLNALACENTVSMASVWEVASEAESGDRIIWKGEKADVENPKPSTVTRVITEVGKITVAADGPRGADVGFWVEKDGTSRVWHGDENMGPVDGVELIDKEIYTRRFEK
jgi:hypothetical protein